VPYERGVAHVLSGPRRRRPAAARRAHAAHDRGCKPWRYHRHVSVCPSGCREWQDAHPHSGRLVDRTLGRTSTKVMREHGPRTMLPNEATAKDPKRDRFASLSHHRTRGPMHRRIPTSADHAPARERAEYRETHHHPLRNCHREACSSKRQRAKARPLPSPRDTVRTP
jgi:hypothetical protein